MKRAIVILFSLIVVTPVKADSWRELCSSYSDLSEKIMTNRQSGVAMSKMMSTVDGQKDAMSKVIEEIIIEAYEKPRYSTERMQKRTIEDFRNSIYLTCAKEMRTVQE